MIDVYLFLLQLELFMTTFCLSHTACFGCNCFSLLYYCAPTLIKDLTGFMFHDVFTKFSVILCQCISLEEFEQLFRKLEWVSRSVCAYVWVFFYKYPPLCTVVQSISCFVFPSLLFCFVRWWLIILYLINILTVCLENDSCLSDLIVTAGLNHLASFDLSPTQSKCNLC